MITQPKKKILRIGLIQMILDVLLHISCGDDFDILDVVVESQVAVRRKKRKKEVDENGLLSTFDRDFPFKKEFKRRSPITGRWLFVPSPLGNLDRPLNVSIPEPF